MNRMGCQDGDAIRRLREERYGPRSVRKFATRVGITGQSLSNIELGNKPAGIEVLVRIARGLEVPVDEILKAPEAEDEPEEAAAEVIAA